MLNWLRLLFHMHEYEVISVARIYIEAEKRTIGKLFISRCKVCGNITRKKIIVGNYFE